MKKVDKILANWFIIFLVISFLLERLWSEVFTLQIAFYSYLVNGVIMVVIRIVYEIIVRRKKKNQ